MKREPALLQELVDGISETGTIANSCRLNGVSNGAFFNWCKQSAMLGGEEFMVSVGEEPLLFHEAVKMAQRQVSFAILENFRSKLLRGGSFEVARFQGRTVYQRDPALDHLSDQDLETLGITTRYLRGPDGNFLPELIFHETSTQATLAFLASEFKQFGSRQTIEVSSKSTGVHIVRHQFAPKLTPAPLREVTAIAAIEPPIIEIEPDDAEQDDLSDVLGKEVIAQAAEPALVVEPVAPARITEPSPAEPARVSELTRDLLDRLARRSGADRAPTADGAQTAEMPNVGRPEADDLDPRRTGRGSAPPANAVKMV